METKLIQDNFDINLFNSCAINPLQSWEWGETRKAIGKEIYRFGLFDKNKLKSVYTVILYNLPRVKYKVGHLIFSEIPSPETINFMQSTLAEYNVVFIKIEPYKYSADQQENIQSFNEWKSLLDRSSIKNSPSESRYMYDQTIILDLTKEESQLNKELRKSTRYTIRNAYTKLVQIEESEDFQTFWNVFESTVKRQNYYAHDENYHITVWENMRKNISKFFIAKLDEDVLAAFEIFFFNQRAYYVYSGSSDKNRQLGGSNILMWETILRSKALGCNEFDLWGIGDKPSFRGFSSFKEGYGGQKVYMMEGLDIVFDQYLYWGYKYLNGARLFLRDILRND